MIITSNKLNLEYNNNNKQTKTKQNKTNKQTNTKQTNKKHQRRFLVCGPTILSIQTCVPVIKTEQQDHNTNLCLAGQALSAGEIFFRY